jgi:hypothetical protein
MPSTRSAWNTYVATLKAQALDEWAARATPVAKSVGLIK